MICDMLTVTLSTAVLNAVIKEDFIITSASHAVPFSDGLRHLLCDVNAVAMEPLITVITATVRGRSRMKKIMYEHPFAVMG